MALGGCSPGGPGFWLDYHVWGQKFRPETRPRAGLHTPLETANEEGDPPPRYEEVDPAMKDAGGASYTVNEIRERLTKVKTAMTAFEAINEKGNNEHERRNLCATICRETSISFERMRRCQLDVAFQKVEMQWIQEDFIQVFLTIFSYYHRRTQKPNKATQSEITELGRVFIRICPSTTVAYEALCHFMDAISQFPLGDELVTFERLINVGIDTSRFAGYVLYLGLYRRLLQQYDNIGENTYDEIKILIYEVIKYFVGKKKEFTELDRDFGALCMQWTDNGVSPEELVKRLGRIARRLDGYGGA